MLIEIDRIIPNPEQPRQAFDEEGLKSLAQSIKANGVIQPIVVEISGDGETYILHDGERRWRAAKIAGLQEIPAEIVEPLGDDDARRDRLTRALVANVQREDLGPLEIARAYARMHDELGMSDQAIADQIGKARSSVTNARRLLELPVEVQALANEEGVSERIMMALLPIYQMPPEALKIVEQHWSSPQRLISDIKTGQTTNSDQVRSRARSIIRDGTHSLKDVFPTGHEFDATDDIRSSRCDDCPLLVKVGKEPRCPVKSCYEAKSSAWQVSVMEAASEIHGIPALPEEADWSTYNCFYGDKDIVDDIIANGCENLRLKFEQWSGMGGYRLSDYPQIAVVCYHGTDDDKQCTCLQAARAQHPELVEDPERAERERTRAEYQSLIAACGRVVGAAIEAKNTQVWRWVLATLPYVDGRKEWDIGQMCQALGERAVDYYTSYDARANPALARSEISEVFEALGLAIPEPLTPAEDIRRRFDRIHGWIDRITGGDEEPTLAAIQGNLVNLEKITDEFDAISHEQLDNKAFDGFLVDLAVAWETLDTLKHEIETNGRVFVGAQTETT
jgi:ParB/RepB/Spo0J family partition protein